MCHQRKRGVFHLARSIMHVLFFFSNIKKNCSLPPKSIDEVEDIMINIYYLYHKQGLHEAKS
jgi:hypothetical protein